MLPIMVLLSTLGIIYGCTFKCSYARFLEAQLLSSCIDVTDSLHHSVTKGGLAISATSSLFMDRFARSFGVCHQYFDKEAIYYG